MTMSTTLFQRPRYVTERASDLAERAYPAILQAGMPLYPFRGRSERPEGSQRKMGSKGYRGAGDRPENPLTASPPRPAPRH